MSLAIVRILVVAAVVVAAAPARADQHSVDCNGGGDFLSIQEAFDAASNGDTVLVSPCVYTEQLRAEGKCLVIVGEGAEGTVLLSSGEEPALSFTDMPAPWESSVSRMAIGGRGRGEAIRWEGGRLILRGCVVTGDLAGGDYLVYESAAATLANCDLDDVSVYGCLRTSVVESCSIGRAFFFGCNQGPHHTLQSTESTYDYVGVSLLAATIEGGAIGRLSVDGWGTEEGLAHVTRCALGLVDISPGGDVQLIDCTLDSLFWLSSFYPQEPLVLEHCLVKGNISMLYQEAGAFRIIHNTILGSFRYSGTGTHSSYHDFRSNVVLGDCSVDAGPGSVVVSHNDVLGDVAVLASGGSVYANFSEDPLFCDAFLLDFSLEDCSPCVGAAHDGGDVGAYPVGCACAVCIQQESWGRIKAIFR